MSVGRHKAISFEMLDQPKKLVADYTITALMLHVVKNLL